MSVFWDLNLAGVLGNMEMDMGMEKKAIFRVVDWLGCDTLGLALA